MRFKNNWTNGLGSVMKIETILLDLDAELGGRSVEITFILLTKCCYIWIGLASSKAKMMGNLSVAMNFIASSRDEKQQSTNINGEPIV